MSSFFSDDFEEFRRTLTGVAKTAPKGLDHEQITPGAIITFSSCRATGDRSYTDAIFRVVATTPADVIVKMIHGGHRGSDDDGIRHIKLYEREVYAAEHLLSAIEFERPGST